MTQIVCGIEVNMTAEAIEAKQAERERNTCQECGEVSYELEKMHELSTSAHAFHACPECAEVIAGVLDSAENQADYDCLVAQHMRYRKPAGREFGYYAAEVA